MVLLNFNLFHPNFNGTFTEKWWMSLVHTPRRLACHRQRLAIETLQYICHPCIV